MPRRLVLLAVIAAWLVGTSVTPLADVRVARAQETRLLAQVVAVVDGSTLRVHLDDGTVEMVRLRGLVAPAATTSTGAAGCFGSRSAARLAILAPSGSAIELEFEEPARDEDGHLLAYVWREDAMLMVNEQLLAEGYAVLPASMPASAYSEQFVHAQETAQNHNLGLWAACAG